MEYSDVADLIYSEDEISSYRGSTVVFHNLTYHVNVSSGCCRTEPKVILKNVSGVFKPGTLNAIMGPTGSGKSTLLDILAERKHPSGLSGTVLIDGKPQPPDFRLRSGYVVQDDVVMSTLTVKENLQFSANLRLPKELSSEQRRQRVNAVINELSLGNCANTRIGDQFTRGVSGGERKRCNIGMELIPAPGILFLDEPTTGLDASTAHSVMMLLKRLAHSGSTIIFSIHQPRFSIFKLCDTILLLGNGQTIYHGPALQGIDFFKTCGYFIEEHDNPADFYLDVLIGGCERDNGSNVSFDETDGQVCLSVGDPIERTNQKCQQLAECFVSSDWYNSIQAEILPYISDFEKRPHVTYDDITRLTYHTSVCTQFGVLCRRTFLNLMRNPRTGIMQWFITIIFGTITGAIFFQLKDSCNPGIQDRLASDSYGKFEPPAIIVGSFFFIVMNQIFANLSAIDLFILERAIFMHENVSGYYRVSAYFFSKLFCDLLPYRTFPVIIFGSITYWMIGLVARWQSFLIFLVTIITTSWSATFVAFAASATTRQQAIASLIVALVYVIQMVFSGLLINLKDKIWIKWLKYLSIFNYSMTALQVNEFGQVNFYDDHGINCVKGYNMSYLEVQDIAYGTAWDLWFNIVALGGITLLFMIIAYIQLRRIQKLK